MQPTWAEISRRVSRESLLSFASLHTFFLSPAKFQDSRSLLKQVHEFRVITFSIMNILIPTNAHCLNINSRHGFCGQIFSPIFQTFPDPQIHTHPPQLILFQKSWFWWLIKPKLILYMRRNRWLSVVCFGK